MLELGKSSSKVRTPNALLFSKKLNPKSNLKLILKLIQMLSPVRRNTCENQGVHSGFEYV